MSNILTLNGVNAYYGSSHILFGVDLAVRRDARHVSSAEMA